ncbi:hypothetical protein ACOJQI_03970 [Bacillus salacetis]
MSDWNEQAAPNNNLGSTPYKKALSTNVKSKNESSAKHEKKHDRK